MATTKGEVTENEAKEPGAPRRTEWSPTHRASEEPLVGLTQVTVVHVALEHGAADHEHRVHWDHRKRPSQATNSRNG